MTRMTPARQARNFLLSLIIRGSIPAGWLLCRDSRMWGNWILMLEWWYWIGFAMFSICTLAYIVEGVKAPGWKAGDPKLANLREMHLIQASFYRKAMLWALEIPSILFVGVAMGRWWLLIPMCLSSIAGQATLVFASATWMAVPEAVRCPTPEAKAGLEEELESMARGPIRNMAEGLRRKRAAEDKEEADVVDKLLGGDDA